MMAATIVCVAAFSRASSVKWSESNLFAGNSNERYAGTLYLFDAATVSGASLFAALETSNDLTATLSSSAINSMTITAAAGVKTSSEFTYGSSGNTYNLYFAAILNSGDKDYVYISAERLYVENVSMVPTVAFGNQSSGSQLLPTADGYQGAGKWSAAPEPTSGLMMLLGMASLALKRKRV